jgi:hypothetical protein
MRFALATILIATSMVSTLPATAATPSSWKDLDTAARTGCAREITRLASKAKVGAVTGRISGIGAADDTDRYYGLILDGKTVGFASQWFCLYDKRAKTAVAREIEKR